MIRSFSDVSMDEKELVLVATDDNILTALEGFKPIQRQACNGNLKDGY